MSISYCAWCETLQEGNTQTEKDEYGCEYEACKDCGEEITELSEDDPKDER